MKIIYKYINPIIFLILAICLAFLYKDLILQKKILFPSNFLVSFYSPWSTEKIKGWEHGIPHKPIGDDQIRIFYPSRTFTNEMLTKKIIPFWNPYVFAGTPHLADFQSAVFYPLNIVYAFLPQNTAWSLLLIIQPIMATIFMYLFLRLFKLEEAALWLGSIAFGFSGFILVWSQENVVVAQSALWLPLAFFGIEGFLKTNKYWYYLIAVLSLAFSFLAGFFQVTFYIFALVLIYAFFRIKDLQIKNKIRNILFIVGIYLFSLSLSAIQLFPSIEGFLNSPRSISSAWYLFEGYLLPVTHIFNIFVPDIFGNPGSYNFFGRGFYRETIIYIGLVPTIFAIYAFFKKNASFVIRFFIVSAIVSFLLALDSPFTRWFFHLPLPLLPTFLPSRIFIITTFSLAVLSAFGFSIWLKQIKGNKEKIMTYILFMSFIILSIIAIYAFIMLLSVDKFSYFKQINNYIIRNYLVLRKIDILVMLRNLVIPFLILVSLSILIRFKKRSVIILGIIILTIFGQLYFLNKYKVLGDPQFIYPKNDVISFLQSRNNLDRFISLGEPIYENTSTYTHTYSIEGVNPIFPKRYGQLLFAASTTNGKITNDIPRVEARLSEIGDNERLYKDSRRLRLLSLLNARYILYFDHKNSPVNVKEKFPDDVFQPVWNKNNWYAFEYRKVLPRVFLVSNIYIENNPQKILDLIFDPNLDLANTVILEEKTPEIIQIIKNSSNSKTLSSNSRVKIITYEPQKIEILATTDSPKILFLSDNYYPGWKAYVDNNPTKIYQADYTFRGIFLPSGKHTVKFLYQPLSFQLGLYLTLLSAVILLSIILVKLFTYFLLQKRLKQIMG